MKTHQLLRPSPSDQKDYYFYHLEKAFTIEIQSHARRTGISRDTVRHLQEIAISYVSGLSTNRTNLWGATNNLAIIYNQLAGISPDKPSRRPHHREDFYQPGHWKLFDFFVTTPLNLENRLLDQPEEVRGPSPRFTAFYDMPSDVIVASFEYFVLSFGLDGFNRALHESSYRYFTTAMQTEEKSFTVTSELAAYRKRMARFMKNIHCHKGDIPGLGAVLKKHLSKQLKTIAGGSRAMYVDPFYPRDLAKITFPSAEADFVAARFAAL